MLEFGWGTLCEKQEKVADGETLLAMPGKSKFQISRSLDERIRRIISGSNEHDPEFAHANHAYILGFNYGNVTNCVGLTTNYQLHHAVFPVVGLAYFKSVPAENDVKASLESIREYSSSPNGLGSFKSDKNEHLFLIYNIQKNTNEVEKRIFNVTKGTFVRRKQLRLNVLNDPYTPRHVYTGGFEDIFNLDDGDSMAGIDDDQVDHLIFFIHGVGGVCDVRFRSVVEVVADFRKMANDLLAQHSNPSSGSSTPSSVTNKHLAQHFKRGFFRRQSSRGSSTSRGSDEPSQASPSSGNRVRRVECLPVSWHSLTRRQTGMNEQFNMITLNSVPKLRHFLHKVVLDALLYSSGPVYNQTIINNVGNEINRLYTLFMEKNPNFSGSVSLAGHSLGSVIVFDLLAHQIDTNRTQQQHIASPSTTDHTTATSLHKTTCTEGNNHHINNHNNNIISETDNLLGSNGCKHVAHEHNITSNNSNNRNFCSDYRNLEELLLDMNLKQYTDLFRKEHIDLESLLLLTDLDLKDLNLPIGVRRKLGTYINYKKTVNSMNAFAMHPTETGTDKQNAQYKTLNSQPPQQHDSSTSSENFINNRKNVNDPNNNTDLFNNINTGQYLIEYPQLKFKPKCFFAFGSPMSMFLNVRGIQNISKDYKLPTCDRMYNIFHPYDPLAYRIEPLIDYRFKDVEPVLLAHHRGGKRIHVQLREGFARVGHDLKQRVLGSIRNTWSTFTRFNSGSAENSRQTSVESQGSSETSKRITRSASSSVEVEIESAAVSKSNRDVDSSSGTRKPLKRQPIVRSQSDLTSLTSIIEGTPEADTDLIGAEEDLILKRLRSFTVARSTSETTDCSTSTQNQETYGTPDESSTIIIDASASDTANKDKGKSNASKRAQQKSRKQVKHDGQRTGKESILDESAARTEPVDTSRIGRLNGGKRIDYVLQEKPIELFNEYIFAFTSHANYWQNEDSALIILNEIYGSESAQVLGHFD